jgi:hypothetical protein
MKIVSQLKHQSLFFSTWLVTTLLAPANLQLAKNKYEKNIKVIGNYY